MRLQKILYAAAASAFAVASLSVGASAADLGGDCCADLEERVAELEATTVRKGNRKVSLKLSGHVNTAIFYWDDGINSDAYVVENTENESRFRLGGNAAITPDLGDGYAAAMTNFKFIANAVVTTEEAVEAIKQSGGAYEAAGAG